MKHLKYLFRNFKRYFKSLFWIFKLKHRNKGKSIGLEITEFFGLYENIHILCPGSSLDKILDSKIEKPALLIFVNHALDICDIELFNGFHKIAFTADVCRAKEIINKKNNKLHKCKSVLAPVMPQFLRQEILNTYEYIFDIDPTFSIKYGFVAKAYKNYQKINPPNHVFNYFGYGSLNGALIFSILFQPKQINIWGCDFYSSKNNLYSSLTDAEKYTYNVDFGHYEDRVRSDFDLVKKYFDSIGTELLCH